MRITLVAICLAVATAGCSKSSTDDIAPPGASEGQPEAQAGSLAAGDERVEALIGGLVAPTPLAERREVTVQAVWFRGPAGPQASGGTSPVVVRVDPNDSGQASVGVIEEYAGGTGNMWRTAAWLAALNASGAAGHLLTDHEFLVRTGGHIDGPSGGMLITATMLAMLNGVPVRADTTMSGTVNPDGSAGPVGGLPQKMQGAKASGLTRFGYPVGTRTSQDLQTGRSVDLESYGRDLGLEVREINDLRDAYSFMTDRELPTPSPASEGDMGLDPDLRTRVKAKILQWKSALEGRLAALERRVSKTPRNQRAMLGGLLADVGKRLELASRYDTSGFEVAAYETYAVAVTIFHVCTELTEFFETVNRRRFEQLDEQLARLAGVQAKIEALGLELGVSSRRDSIGGVVNTLGAFAHYNAARAYVLVGLQYYERAATAVAQMQEGATRRTPKAIEEVIQQLAVPVIYFTAADALVQIARESLDLAPEEGRDLEVDEAKLEALAKAYGSAASAGVAYFEATVVEPHAAQANVSLGEARSLFEMLDGNYIAAPVLASLAAQPEAFATPGARSDTPMLRLSSGVAAYIGAAGLVNKFYSLGYSPQQDGSYVLTRRRALGSQLDLAKRSALEAAGEAQRLIGFIPATAKLAFEAGSAMREGDDEEKLTALSHYWLSAFWSNLAVTLSR